MQHFALAHPALFAIAFHRAETAIWPRFRAAAMETLAVLDKRFAPLQDADLLGRRSVSEASTQFRALGEGAAWTELRGNPLSPDPERFWRSAFHALITGFAASQQAAGAPATGATGRRSDDGVAVAAVIQAVRGHHR